MADRDMLDIAVDVLTTANQRIRELEVTIKVLNEALRAARLVDPASLAWPCLCGHSRITHEGYTCVMCACEGFRATWR